MAGNLKTKMAIFLKFCNGTLENFQKNGNAIFFPSRTFFFFFFFLGGGGCQQSIF